MSHRVLAGRGGESHARPDVAMFDFPEQLTRRPKRKQAEESIGREVNGKSVGIGGERRTE